MDAFHLLAEKLCTERGYSRVIALDRTGRLRAWVGSGASGSAQSLGVAIAAWLNDTDVRPHAAWPIGWHTRSNCILVVTRFGERAEDDLEAEVDLADRLSLMEKDRANVIPTAITEHAVDPQVGVIKMLLHGMSTVDRQTMLAPLTRLGLIDGVTKTAEEVCAMFELTRGAYRICEQRLLERSR